MIHDPAHVPTIDVIHAMYRRTVASWVLDLARLRHRGLDRATPRRPRRGLDAVSGASLHLPTPSSAARARKAA
jgi:hypothetical protein